MSKLDDVLETMQQEIIKQARSEYSATVVEHWMQPRNPYAMEQADGKARIKGPCGDTMEIFVRVKDGKVADASFVTDGCMSSIVCGSMAVQTAIGKRLPDARVVSQDDILAGLGGLPEENQHCALLASNTLRAAIDAFLGAENDPEN